MSTFYAKKQVEGSKFVLFDKKKGKRVENFFRKTYCNDLKMVVCFC